MDVTESTDESYLIRYPPWDKFVHSGPNGKPVDPARIEAAANTKNLVQTAASMLSAQGIVIIKDVLGASDIAAFLHASEPLLKRVESSNGVHGDVVRWDDCTVIKHTAERADVWPLSPAIADPLTTKVDPVVLPVLRAYLATGVVRKTAGLLVTASGCKAPGKWHRDAAPLLRSAGDAYADAHLVRHTFPFYATVFVPLTEQTTETGATEYVPRSNNMMHNEVATAESAPLVCSPGDIVVLAGTTVHRGSANPSVNDARVMPYVVYCAPWYNEHDF